MRSRRRHKARVATICTSLRDPITARSAELNYKRNLRDFADARTFGRVNDRCPLALRRRHVYGSCIEHKGDVFYLPPFQTLPLSKSLVLFLDEQKRYRDFVPIDQTVNGPETLSKWQTYARDGKLFDCEGPDCLTIVSTLNPEKGEKILALCPISNVKGVIGAPENCTEIVVLTHGKPWILAIVRSYMIQMALGLPDFDIKIYSKPALRTDSVFGVIQDSLTAPPLMLFTERHSPRTLIALASHRASPLLVGWREWVTVRIDLDYFRYEEPPYLGMTVSTTIYVNRQNTDRPSDWTLPSAQQQNMYVEEIRNKLTPRLSSLCRDHVWLDSSTLRCAGDTSIECEASSDCEEGKRCRSRKGGGTECR